MMNESRRNELGLPTQAMVPVVSKAKHIKTSIIDRGKWLNLKESDERVWLFRPKDDRAKHSEVKAYLELKTELGGCNRDAYKVTIREPWYRVRLPVRPHAFISGMSREGPWLSFNGMPRLNATNTLYV